jgi:hypothetical protein
MNFSPSTHRAVLLSCAAFAAAALLGGCNGGASLPGSTSSNSAGAGGSPSTDPSSSHRKRRRHRSAPNVTVTINPSQVGPAMNVSDLGVGMGVWYNFTLPGIAQAFQNANLTTTRFPGGAQADIYHWQTDTDGPSGTPCAGSAKRASTFDALMQDIAIPANLRVNVTVNYGSNADCTAGADPSEGAALIAEAQQKGYNVVYATIGNEQYVPGAIDCRQPGCVSSRDPYQYSANEPAFYDAVKQANPNVNVCVDANLQNSKSKWNLTVFPNAKYDCIEVHYYPQRLTTSDSFLLYDAIPQFTTDLNAIKTGLATAGHPNTPIYLGEIASQLGPYGKQSQSIVGALFTGMAIGEVEQDGLAAMTWHIGLGSCNGPNRGGDFGQDVYGWQDYGGAMIFSDGHSSSCPAQSAANTMLATGSAFLAGSYFVHAGENMLGALVTGSGDVRAYAGTYKGGYAFMLFNLSQTDTQDVAVNITGKTSGSGGTVVTYDKAIYDQSQNNVWNPPSVAPLGAWNGYVDVSLPPWSMVVVQTQ